MQPPEGAWPVPLSSVLAALEVDDEVLLDLGPAGAVVVRRTVPTVPILVPRTDDLPALSERGARVLGLVAGGLPAVVVARTVGLALPDLAHELALLRERYGADSTASAVARARAVGDLG
ncbi:hypothetical protein [Kineococcus sp. R86509]|uniref:hypothetical protein n=1 Tax=Kineococcus sp. R86509 TaxID=3093851 RepID=UPI0036D2F5C4